jgi:hypothetical protein
MFVQNHPIWGILPIKYVTKRAHTVKAKRKPRERLGALVSAGLSVMSEVLSAMALQSDVVKDD